jgi:hypothetical protein
LLTCIEAGYGPERRKQVAEQLAARTEEASSGTAGYELRERYRSRIFDVSVFIKELKGRFAQWYNRRHQRYGVLWAERFKSVLIEPGHALSAVAAYIDLNPLRAGLCEDPKDYRYSGYAEAVAKNSTKAQQGLSEALGSYPNAPWKEVSSEYRKLLFRTGTSASKASATIDLHRAQEVVQQQQGELPLSELLRCRVRYFTDGGILGSRAFVQEQFASFKRLVNPAHPSRAHPLRGVADRQIWVLRDLRVRPIG